MRRRGYIKRSPLRRNTKRIKRSPLKRTRRKPRSRRQASRQEKRSLQKDRLLDRWSKLVRLRDHHVCVACGSLRHLQAHHWIMNKGRSLRTAFLIDNGVTLCSYCHLIKLHKLADAETFDKVKAYMATWVIPDRYEEIKRLAKRAPREALAPVDLDFYDRRFTILENNTSELMCSGGDDV